MAAGVPVIQTTQGWIKEFIEEHQAGFTVNGHNPEQLANILLDLKDNPSRARETGARGAAVAAKFFDKDYLAANMLEILKSVHEAD